MVSSKSLSLTNAFPFTYKKPDILVHVLVNSSTYKFTVRICIYTRKGTKTWCIEVKIAPFIGTLTRICHSLVRRFAGLFIPSLVIGLMSCSVHVNLFCIFCALRSIDTALNFISLRMYEYMQNINAHRIRALCSLTDSSSGTGDVHHPPFCVETPQSKNTTERQTTFRLSY